MAGCIRPFYGLFTNNNKIGTFSYQRCIAWCIKEGTLFFDPWCTYQYNIKYETTKYSKICGSCLAHFRHLLIHKDAMLLNYFHGIMRDEQICEELILRSSARCYEYLYQMSYNLTKSNIKINNCMTVLKSLQYNVCREMVQTRWVNLL